MIKKLMGSSLFFFNANNYSEMILKKADWILTDNLTPMFIEKIKENQFKFAFIKEENVFSHGMNVLRKVLFNTNIIAVVGIKEIYGILQNAEECKVSIEKNTITIGGIEYKFKDFNFLRDTSEIIEYNLETKEICYKPDFYYNSELAAIIIQGYNIMSSMLPYNHLSIYDKDGRIWSSGFCFPYQFFEYFLYNLQTYYSNLLNYIDILEKLFSLRFLTHETQELKEFLIYHYSYSTLFSFLTPNISNELTKLFSIEEIEKVYNVFVVNSPIHDKKNLTEESLKKIKLFLTNILNGVDNKKNYLEIYKVNDISTHEMTVMYFVTNMISDIRRCVINTIIDHNTWFNSICKHRKKVKIY